MEPRPQDCGLLIVSDLHLSEGRREGTKRFSRNEDFFFDAEFARFLDHYRRAERWRGARWHLVIAGDFLDLLQVVSTDGAPPELRRDPDHPEYGLAGGEAESVFKVAKVASGHWQFFEALGAFVADGNRLTILKGNHDVELHYPRVQQALVAELRRAFERVASQHPSARAERIGAETVRFGEWFHYEKGLVWIEHGNRYDPSNTFRTWLSPLLPDRPGIPPGRNDEIDLPLGSLFVRYLFNRIETAEPFADNIKPQARFVRWLLSRHPITALRFVLGDGRYMLRKLRRACAPLPEGAFRAREEEHRRELERLASEAGIDRSRLEQIDALRARSVLEETRGTWPRLLVGAIRRGLLLPLVYAALAAAGAIAALAALQVVSVLVPSVGRLVATAPWLGRVQASAPWALVLVAAAAAALRRALAPEEGPAPSGLADAASRIAALLGVRHVVMGHTHDADLCALDRGEYFNTGTWTKVFSEEERLVRDDVEFVFVQGVRRASGDLQLKLLEWDDGAGEPRLLKLFEDGSSQAPPRAAAIGASERARAVEILAEERERHAIPPRREIPYRLLRIAVSGFTVAYLAILALAWLRDWVAVRAFVEVAAAAGAVFLAGALVLLVLNVPSFVKAARQRLKLPGLGLAQTWASMWRERRKASLASRAWSWVVLGVGIVVPISLIVKLSVAWSYWLALLVAVPLIGQHLIRRGKEWRDVLAEVDRLAGELGSHPAGDGLPAAVLSRGALQAIAKLEAAQIERDRMRAIAAGLGVERGWGLLATGEFSARRSRLSREEQLAVQDLLDRLGLDPRGEPARQGADGSWRARTAGGVEVVYRIDEAERRLRLASVETEAAARVAAAQGGH
jgi:UDP-2,3-diacylglucosamine pyrophosphatase LpxH